MKLFLTDINYRKTFDVFNCLKKSNYELILTEEYPKISNKFIYNQKIYQLRKNNIENFSNDLNRIQKSIKDKRIVYIPVEEDTTILFYRHLEKYGEGKFRFALPNKSAFNLSRDKLKLNRFCESNEIPCPKEFSYTDLVNNFVKVVAKPRFGNGGKGLYFIDKKDDLKLVKHKLTTYLIQKQLKNRRSVEGAFFLFKNGKFIDYYGHKRIRTYPVDAGVTVFSKKAYNNRVKEIGESLLKKLNWNGLAMIEFLYDVEEKQYKVIEINPRLWGSILLSEFANTGFLHNYINVSLNRKEKKFQQKKDVFIRWIFPFDLINYFKTKGDIPNFWRFSRQNICYIGFTYSTIFRSVMFLLYNVFDREKIKKFIKKANK
jgi:glutathione synthase/RimK-type ligase-like ATP-grasp enzyme